MADQSPKKYRLVIEVHITPLNGYGEEMVGSSHLRLSKSVEATSITEMAKVLEYLDQTPTR